MLMLPIKCTCSSLSSQVGSIVIGIVWMIGSTIAILIVPNRTDTFMLTTDIKITIAALYIIEILLSALMVLGALKKKWQFIVPWLIMQSICAFFFSNTFIITSSYSFSLENIIYLTTSLVIAGLCVFSWYIPFSYVITLMEENKRGTYTEVPYAEKSEIMKENCI